MLACCGLDCSGCEAYLATQADDDPRRAEVAKKWSAQYHADIRPEHVNCDGCRADGRKFFHCSDFCEVRKCCLERTLPHCAACDMYACEKLEEFFKQAPQARSALDSLRAPG